MRYRATREIRLPGRALYFAEGEMITVQQLGEPLAAQLLADGSIEVEPDVVMMVEIPTYSEPEVTLLTGESNEAASDDDAAERQAHRRRREGGRNAE